MEGNPANHVAGRFVLEDAVRVNRDLDAIWTVLGRVIMAGKSS